MSTISAFNYETPTECDFVVGRELNTKADLISAYANALSFPYGMPNWDSFADCMNDLEWIAAPIIKIHHTGLPLSGSVSDQKTYLDILREAVCTAANYKAPLLQVSFASELRANVEALQDEK